jgi:hypothetical protein
MSDVQAISLTKVYKGWEVYQNHLLQATRPLTAEQLKLRAVPHLRSMGELIAHIIGCRASWYHYQGVTLKEKTCVCSLQQASVPSGANSFPLGGKLSEGWTDFAPKDGNMI